MKHKHRLTNEGVGVNLSLVVTPFLDFSFQLLFLFVCMYQPSSLEGQIQMRLPMEAEAKGDATAPNLGEDPKVDAEITVRVKTDQGGLNVGGISQLLVIKEGKETEVKDLKELLAKLKQMRENLTNTDDIKLQGDKQLKWDRMIAVVDACRQAGFKNPGFQAPPEPGAGP